LSFGRRGALIRKRCREAERFGRAMRFRRVLTLAGWLRRLL
jgi:hypothetical protein